MRESKSSTIGGLTYTVTQLGANDGRKVFIRLAKLLGAGATSKEPIAGVLSALNDDDVTFLCDTFAKVTAVHLDEKRQPWLNTIFDEHFAGKMSDQLKWLGFCVEVNFGNFLNEFGLTADALTRAQDKVKANLSKSQPASTGPSGDPSTKDGQL